MKIEAFGSNSYIKPAAKNSKGTTSGTSFAKILSNSVKEEKSQSVEDSYVNNAVAVTKNQFSGTYKERLQQLNQLNANTDWNSMSDVEKVKLFETRYREAFSGTREVLTNLYCEYSSMHHEIYYDNYLNEKRNYFDKGGIAPLESDYMSNYKKAFYGDMTDDEVRTAINKEYSKNGSMENKYMMICEYARCGVNKPGEFGLAITIESQIFAQVENAHKVSLYGTGMSISEHPRFLDMYMSYAKGIGEGKNYMPGWEEIVSYMKEMYRGDPLSETINSTMDDFLDDIL